MSLKLSETALAVLRARYLLRDETGRLIETPEQMFRRAAKFIARSDKKYDKQADTRRTESKFYELMSESKFLPNSPVLMNAGTRLNQLAACFVLPVEDSLESIFDALKHTALIQQSGGGTGFSFSKLRPRGDIVKSTKGVASGPVSFMSIFDKAIEVIKQGGKRRGASMGVLSASHPDIEEFINVKRQNELTNFNLSVAVTDKFMRAAEKNQSYELVNPRMRKSVKSTSARQIFSEIVGCAHETGDPGMLFMDEINKRNPLKGTRIEATNPCGEVPLLPYESCVLGSLNISKFVTNADIDWHGLGNAARVAVHFLDNTLDVNRYPLPEIREASLASRKIGLGVMGWADALIQLGIPYDSQDALKLAGWTMRFITAEARKASAELGRQRGNFPLFKQSVWAKCKSMRNATVTAIAPTGSISIIASCSSGIEPLFAVSYVKEILSGERFFETNSLFEAAAKKHKLPASILNKIKKTGSVRGSKVPLEIKKLFATALDIAPSWHVKMQAAFQKYTDNAVSKTIALKENATKKDVEKVYKLASKLGCKGVTVYRYGSKPKQVLSVGRCVRCV